MTPRKGMDRTLLIMTLLYNDPRRIACIDIYIYKKDQLRIKISKNFAIKIKIVMPRAAKVSTSFQTVSTLASIVFCAAVNLRLIKVQVSSLILYAKNMKPNVQRISNVER